MFFIKIINIKKLLNNYFRTLFLIKQKIKLNKYYFFLKIENNGTTSKLSKVYFSVRFICLNANLENRKVSAS